MARSLLGTAFPLSFLRLVVKKSLEDQVSAYKHQQDGFSTDSPGIFHVCTPNLHCEHQATRVYPSLTPVLPIPMFSPFLKGQPSTLTTWCQPWTFLPWPTFQPASSPQSCTPAWLCAYCLGGICRKQHGQVLSFQSRGAP